MISFVLALLLSRFVDFIYLYLICLSNWPLGY